MADEEDDDDGEEEHAQVDLLALPPGGAEAPHLGRAHQVQDDARVEEEQEGDRHQRRGEQARPHDVVADVGGAQPELGRPVGRVGLVGGRVHLPAEADFQELGHVEEQGDAGHRNHVEPWEGEEERP